MGKGPRNCILNTLDDSGADGGGKVPVRRNYQEIQLRDVGLDVLEQVDGQESKNHGILALKI